MKKNLILIAVFINIIFINTANSKSLNYNIFGYAINSPIGVAACPITTSKGIKSISKMGYDIITYKTIRSCEQQCHKAPNIFFVDCKRKIRRSDICGKFCAVGEHEPTDLIKRDNSDSCSDEFLDNLTITNSFGISSQDPEETIRDIKLSREMLQDGQVLIVSVYGSGNTSSCAKAPEDRKEQIDDFVKTAKIAVAGGAQIIEANLSCPNIADNQKLIYQDPILVHDICRAINQEIPEIPLIVKIGLCENLDIMKDIFVAAHNGGAKGICGINTVPVSVVDELERPVFDEQRKMSGLSGSAIFDLTLEFVKNAKKIIKEEKLDLKLFATGGVTRWQQFDILLAAGADIVQCATGAMWNKTLALDYHSNHSSKNCDPEKVDLIKTLFGIEAIKIKDIQIKSGAISPIYFDMRLIISYPEVLKHIAIELKKLLSKYKFDIVCGVPYAAVPLATSVSLLGKYSMIMHRKEVKSYGTKKTIEGNYSQDNICAVIEDVITTGSSILETVKVLENNGLIINDIFVLIDREQNGVENVQKHGYKVHPLFTITEILQVLLAEKLITHNQFATIKQFCLDNKINI